MRRFSQRHHLVTLSDINITPLLDLAFVLLIIFVITTPFFEQGMNLKLPAGGRVDQKIERKNVRTVEIDRQGAYMLDRKMMSLDQLEVELARAYQANTNVVIYIRADEESPYKHFAALLSRCDRQGLKRFSPRYQVDK